MSEGSTRLGWITYTPEYAEEHKDRIRECSLPNCSAPYIIGFEDGDNTYCSIGCWFAAREGGTPMPKFRKKPIVVEAMQFLPMASLKELIGFCGGIHKYEPETGDVIYIKTLEGVMMAQIGDWIIKGVQGEFYPCKPDIFVDTYEAVEDADV